MTDNSYLTWLVKHTPTVWWHDSADAAELAAALEHGACGVTTNPVLVAQALRQGGVAKFPELACSDWRQLPAAERSEWLTALVVKQVARTMEPEFARSGGQRGLVCAQVNPNWAGDREKMLGMARRLTGLAPNLVVKLPATAAGFDVLERCIGDGIRCAATVSFTVAQVLAAAACHARGIRAAQAKQITPGSCLAVVMIGRLDDYLREVAADSCANLTEAMIRQAGLAVVKRAYETLRRSQSPTRLCVAALRGTYHLTELAGGEVVMSIHPKYQAPFARNDLARDWRMDAAIEPAALSALQALPEFRRAYEPDGLDRTEFISYGATQRTLVQFVETGWNALETLAV